MLRKFIDLYALQKVLFLTIMKNDRIYCLGEEKLKIKTRCALNSHIALCTFVIVVMSPNFLTDKILKEKLTVS